MDRTYPLWKPAAKSLPRNLDEVVQLFRENFVTAAGDSISTSPIVAQRLDPEVMPVFVRNFPFYDMIEKKPSNGISHTFQQWTAPSQSAKPHTISETGSVTDDANTYLRKTTNIALIAERRGVSLKAKFAGLNAGGPSTDLMAREVTGGLITVARDAQQEMLRWQESDTASTAETAQNGAYDANGLNGLRYILQNQSPPENSMTCDVRTAGWTDMRVLTTIRDVVSRVTDKGGTPNLIVCSAIASNYLFKDQLEFIRYMDDTRVEIIPGRSVRVVSTDAGELPVLVIPGSPGIGTWYSGSTSNASPSGVALYSDMFVLDMETLELPYLGAPEPTVIRIPIGVDGTLRELAIPFALYGLAALAPQYLARVSLQIA